MTTWDHGLNNFCPPAGEVLGRETLLPVERRAYHRLAQKAPEVRAGLHTGDQEGPPVHHGLALYCQRWDICTAPVP